MDYSIENQDIAVYESAADEQEAIDMATVLAEDYVGRKFRIFHVGQPVAVVWWEGGKFHIENVHTPIVASTTPRYLMYRGAVYKEATMPFLYHVTLARQLNSIGEVGLVPGRGESFSGYSGHAKGRLFLSTFEAVDCWVHKFYYIGLGESDNVVEEGWFPVVIRVEADLVTGLVEDRLGDEACRSGKNYYTLNAIPGRDLEYWDGTSWVTFEGNDSEFMVERALGKATKEEEDDGSSWYEMDEKAFYPHHA